MAEAIDPEQAKLVFQAVVLTALADGQTTQEEMAEIAALRTREPIIAAVADPKAAGLEIRNQFLEHGIDVCAQELAAGLTDRRYQEAAFRLCAKVMEADHDTAIEEALLLGTLQELFRFTPEDVKRLMEGAEKG